MQCFLVSYDVRSDKRRTKVASALEDYGQRVQFSVFEVWVTDAHLKSMMVKLGKLIDAEEDSIRVYGLCEACRKKVVVLGQEKPPEPPAAIIL